MRQVYKEGIEMMKKIFAAVTIFLFFSPFVIRADIAGARSDLDNAKKHASDAETYAIRAYSAPVLEEAQFNARKAEEAVKDTQKAIQAAMQNLAWVPAVERYHPPVLVLKTVQMTGEKRWGEW